jgi:hypothetical protein
VVAVIAVMAGVRAGICMIPEPRWMRSVCAAMYASGVTASEPYASAVHTTWKPSRSASRMSGRSSETREPE